MNVQPCRTCGTEVRGNYCSNCGQAYNVKRITLGGLLHDVFHFFTHLEKGFGYTLKQLIVAPGTMQRKYIEGHRGRHQKPFSMFFICATIAALSRYFIYELRARIYDRANMVEANFFHEYWVLMFIIVVPVITLVNWVFFYRSAYNYAEMGVISLYNMSFVLIGAALITLLRLVRADFGTDIIDFTFVLTYNLITFINVFRTSHRWLVAAKVVVATVLIFYMIQVSEDFAKWLVE